MLALVVHVLLLRAAVATMAVGERCEVARMQCGYRIGCGVALHKYMVQCAEVMVGRTRKCTSHCKRALIALASTDEGQRLIECDCRDSEYCSLSKQRMEVCRAEVTEAVRAGSVVSCSVAQLICASDHLCATALGYYHRLCRSMFHGRKCSPRCNNSIAILDRQEKAAKLRECVCDGTEDFACQEIRDNMAWLCFGERPPEVKAPTAGTAGASTTIWTCWWVFLLGFLATWRSGWR